MICVEFREPQNDGSNGHRVAALLRVLDDGSHTIEGNAARVPLRTHMIDPAARERVTFAADPQRWARLTPRNLSSGYLQPVVTLDEHSDRADDETDTDSGVDQTATPNDASTAAQQPAKHSVPSSTSHTVVGAGW